uniref:Uncharacterized protein n=1 Tax=Favella ehrenbergii TaxID=182087 RepID=A0A7S3MTG1_9SPIT
MVFADNQLEEARVVPRIDHDLLIDLLRGAETSQIKVGFSDDDLGAILALHYNLELRGLRDELIRACVEFKRGFHLEFVADFYSTVLAGLRPCVDVLTTAQPECHE